MIGEKMRKSEKVRFSGKHKKVEYQLLKMISGEGCKDEIRKNKRMRMWGRKERSKKRSTEAKDSKRETQG
jgi:hypothetical protein